MNIGLLGGGQLGLMMVEAAKKFGVSVTVYEKKKICPAASACDELVVGDYQDKVLLREFVEKVDVLTVETENIPFDALNYLSAFKKLKPNAESIRITQNRLIEKKFINALGIPTVPFFEINVDNIDTVPASFFPGILKTAMFGYDGKGQFCVDDRATLSSFEKQVSGTEFILEKKVSLDQEVSIILVRDETGNSVCYPLARNTHRNGILIESVMPASDVDPELNKMAQKYAKTIASSLNYVGVLTIEFFICEGSLLVNEIAPRPHNSGHQTIHGCKTSQFEQQVRMCLDLPIGSTEIQHVTRLNNIMGDLWFATNSASPKEPNWELFTCSGKVLKLYGKVEPRIGRKMGHIIEILDNK